ncbi:MAG: (Fe-S)-binding protein [Candidatus Hermodarchaeota archaeon]
MQDYAEQIHRCFKCGYCKFPRDFTDFNCPSYNRFRFESYSTGGRLWLIWAWSNKEIEWSDHLAEIVFSCNTCRNCVEQCPMRFSEDIIDWIIGARSDIVEKGLAPSQIRDFLDNIYQSGNPWGMPRNERDAWAEGIKHYTSSDEYLFYVGCTGSYEKRGQRITRTLSEVLTKTGISFGILGTEEECDGNEVYMLGEIGLFRELAKQNTQQFKDLSVKKIFTLSPHAYNSMKNKYPGIGDIEILHYTHLLHEMIQKGKIDLSALNAKVTYHDPCFLGRYNGVYDIPRDILRQIPGIELVEMERNRENSFCCGGGGGNFVFDLLGRSRDSPSRIRVREAHKTGAEILVVACPNCMTMFDDAIKAEGLEEELAVKDITELVKESTATFK